MIALVGVAVAACGSDDRRQATADVEPTTTMTAAGTMTATATTTAEAPTPTSTSTSTSTPISVTSPLNEPATVSEPADRITDAAVVVWIGGSDVMLDDRDLPAAVGARVESIDDRPLLLVGDTMIAPTVDDVRTRVSSAAERDVDGVIVALNPSWIHWDGAACAGLQPNDARYACLMTPVSASATAANSVELTALFDTIVATGLPAYLYTIPHSADALASPLTGGLVTEVEAEMAAFDPGVDRLEFVGIFNRGLDGMSEGDGFINIVHPSVAGVERLADWLATDLVRFWRDVGL